MARDVGRPRNVESPEKMWELFEAYKKEVKSKPVRKMVFVGKDGSKDWEERERPLTIDGFKNYCWGIVGDITNYLHTNDYEEFSNICSRIKSEVRNDQIDGGMVNIYNPSITQRLNSLTEKTENKTEHSGEIKLNANFGTIIQSSSEPSKDS